jgi:hypothetical protein
MKRKEINLKLKTPRIVMAEVGLDPVPFRVNERLLLLGEIQNMKGHVVVVNDHGIIHWGYHPDNFREATDMDI